MNLQPILDAAFKAVLPFFPDLCDIITLGLQSDGHSGQTQASTVTATGLQCFYEEAPATGNQVVNSGVLYAATHRLYLQRTTASAALAPTQLLKVHARNNVPDLYFEQPTIFETSYQPFVIVLAKRSIGYRQPANI